MLAERFSQDIDVLREVGVLDKTVAPKLSINEFFFYGLFGVLRENDQDLKGLVSQGDR